MKVLKLKLLRRCRRNHDCWEWQGSRVPKGYGSMWAWGRLWRAHRLSWTLWRGGIPDGVLVLHKCDNPPCVNPEHLFLGTAQDNANDCSSRGRRKPAVGEAASKSKLTASDVYKILDLYEAGEKSKRQIAREYGVDHASINKIADGSNWKHLNRIGKG